MRRFRYRWPALSAAAWLLTPWPVVGTESPLPRPRIGLVLSGGGARGAAHVGVLKVLEELRIPVDMITDLGRNPYNATTSIKSQINVFRWFSFSSYGNLLGNRIPIN
jgi:hypothetical protein